MTNEAFSRVRIDAQLRDQGWEITNTNAVRFEYTLPDRTKADYVLCDRNGRSLAVIEAKKAATNPAEAEDQAKAYAAQLGVPYIFLANGNEIRFWQWQTEAFPRLVKTFFSQADLERRAAMTQVKRDLLSVGIDKHIVEREYQTECIDTLCREIQAGRRKLLVEMATGTGKTRTAAAFIKRLFEAGAITRVLFLVDRIPLAKQTEDAFAEHLSDFPAYVLRAGRRFQDEKRITITTLQSMVNIYSEYSAGYFDLVISDECHRSIYGKWSGVLKHFDGVQVGLTATPCIADDTAIGDNEDKLAIRDTLRFFEVDRPTFSYKMKDAIREGYLVPYQIYKAKTVKTAAEGGFEVARDELDWSAMDADTRTELEKLFEEEAAANKKRREPKKTDSITIDPAALERKITIPERNRALVREFRQVMDNGYLDAKGVLRKPLLGKAIVFAVTKRHAETLANMFDQAFADKKPSPEVRYADYVVSGMGDDDTVDGMTKIKRFKREPFPQILVSVNMLDTGFDCPEVVSLVFARFTRSTILYQQMRGRGTRKAKGKPVFTMFDFVGVTDFHGDDEVTGEGGIVVERPRRPPGEPRKLLSLDVNDHMRLVNSSPAAIQQVEVDGKTQPRGLGDKLSSAQLSAIQNKTFFGNDVDPKMIRLATMNLTLRGLPNVRVLLRNVLTTSFDNERKAELGLPPEGYHIVLANPPFSGRVDKDRIVDDVKIGTSTATELLFLKYMMDSLRPGGRCGVIVPEGVLFGSTGAHKELRRQLIENNRVEAVLSLPGGVFQPYSGVKTSVLFFRRGGKTEQVMFLHADNDGYKLDANHDTPVEADDLPGLAAAYRDREARLQAWGARDPKAEWTAPWWFADTAALRVNDFNLSGGRYRPMSQVQAAHQNPRELLDELAAIEAEIAEEVEALRAALVESA